MYFQEDVGLVYATQYDFSLVGTNIQPTPLDARWDFDPDGTEPPVQPPSAVVTIDNVSFSSDNSADFTGYPTLGNLTDYQFVVMVVKYRTWNIASRGGAKMSASNKARISLSFRPKLNVPLKLTFRP